MRTILKLALALVGTIGAAVAMMIAVNSAPTVPAIPAAQVESAAQPYVVKLHARWCVTCMTTKQVWANIEGAYAGKVRFVVFDFTTDASTAASRVDAVRLGLTGVFDEYDGETGGILVLDGASKNVKHAIFGNRPLDEYRAAIDGTIAGVR